MDFKREIAECAERGDIGSVVDRLADYNPHVDRTSVDDVAPYSFYGGSRKRFVTDPTNPLRRIPASEARRKQY